MTTSPVIHWFRRDLRLHDNLALSAAGASGSPILPVFIFDPKMIESKRLGLPRLAFMLQALKSLDDTLRKKGSRLWMGYGDPRELLPKLVKASEARAVYYNRDYTPFAYMRDRALEDVLSVPTHAYDDALLLPPGSVLKKSGDPYTVFTPFKRVWLTLPISESIKMPVKDQFLSAGVIASYTVETRVKSKWPLPLERVPSFDDLGLPGTIEVPKASEREASKRLDRFLEKRVHRYTDGRNELAALSNDDTDIGSSFLSPYLRFGMLSPRQAYWGMQAAAKEAKKEKHRVSVETWLSELVWREFYMHILHHFPYVAKGSFRQQYDKLEWRYDAEDLSAWKEGMTGFPIIDAAMRHLKTMGWMPNRARMIVASFLTKDLLIDWREGERYFMDWLIDGDPAANNGGWQWSAGTGTDAQPYFRIFNPVSQGEKFDPQGAYVKRWLPELETVPTKYIHEPWRMPTPPKGYPAPIVERTLARERTLAAFKAVRKQAAS
ncbi:MAG: DNA photolyase family protein [Chloroflexi bacterium]|nr:DNA photolyase family protein [Chloroflexota bacterium]MCC6894516.1 deoxyribodipyrimidine photo-lyase [Anaerolineae bacterium]